MNLIKYIKEKYYKFILSRINSLIINWDDSLPTLVYRGYNLTAELSNGMIVTFNNKKVKYKECPLNRQFKFSTCGTLDINGNTIEVEFMRINDKYKLFINKRKYKDIKLNNVYIEKIISYK